MNADEDTSPELAVKERGLLRGRPNRAETEQLDKNVLKMALKEFSEKGFHGATLAGIARAAHTTKVTLYRRFGDKEAIFNLVWTHMMTRARLSMDSVTHDTRDPREVLYDLALNLFRDYVGGEAIIATRVAIMEVGRNPSFAYQFNQSARQAAMPLARYFASLGARGLMNCSDFVEAADQFLLLSIGNVRTMLDGPRAPPSEQEAWAKAIVELFLGRKPD